MTASPLLVASPTPRTPASVASGRSPRVRAYVGALVLVLIAMAASLVIGATRLPIEALTDSSHPLHAVAQARIARTLLALAVGAALGLGGAVLQGLTRNPLADTGILGINQGASFAMVVAISVLGISSLQSYLVFAFVGSALAMLIVQGLSALGRDGATPIKIVIAGAALTAVLNSWTTGLLLLDRKSMESFRYWQVGTVGGRDLDVLLTGLPFLAVGAVLALACARTLNALALGDQLARGLGQSIQRDRAVLALAVVLLSGTATALAGPIAFAGLIVPHIVRALVGPDHRHVLPLSVLFGAALVVFADTLGRIVAPPSEVQVGIMTAALGVPVLIALVRRGGVSR